MKQFAVFLFCAYLSLPVLAAKRSKGKMVTIQGVVTQTRDYCGGAAPGPEMLENLSRPVPLPEKELYIRIGPRNKPSRSGQSPIYKKVITNAKGEFSVTLKSNTTYCFIEGWKAKPFKVPANTQFTVWDAACLYEKYIVADYVLKVNSGKNEIVKINFHQRCFFNPYCGTYSGPLPP